MPTKPMPKPPEWTILKLLQWTTSYFSSHNIDSPRAAAEILLAHALGTQRIDLYLRYDQPLLKTELGQFKDLIKRRIRREPVAYITGTKEFWSLDFDVTPDVLIPRPETELLVETASKLLNERFRHAPGKVLELGTGSGAVIIALASQCNTHQFFASDRSLPALATAIRNAKHHELPRPIQWFAGSWFDSLLPEKTAFHIIVSNPPYIPTEEIQQLQPEIFSYEPRIALDGGPDGLNAIRTIFANAHLYMESGGWLLVEIGYDQKTAVEKIATQTGRYTNITFKPDYSGHARVVQLQVKP